MIYLIRHGQTNWNYLKKIQGQSDIPLNETGKNEAYERGQQLCSYPIDKIISSDLSRAKETAEIINGFLNLSIRFDSRLREVNYGDLQGVFNKDISKQTWEIFNNEPHKLNAESFEDVYLRVKSFFNEIDMSKNTLLVTHGGFIRMALYFAENQDVFQKDVYEKTYQFLEIRNTDIFDYLTNF